MNMVTVNEIAKIVGGKVQGNGKITLKGMSPAAFATEGDLTFAIDEESMKIAQRFAGNTSN